MKATYGNIVNQNRNALQDVIPLDTPYVVALDPCNICNFACKFCGIQTLKYEVEGAFAFKCMEFDLYKKIIDDISQMPNKLKMLRLAGNGEPLLNKDFCEMVRYASDVGVAECIETITNASCLNPELNQKLADSGLDRIRISIEALDDDGYKRITGKDVDFQSLVKNIGDLHKRCSGGCQIYVKTVNVSVPRRDDYEKFLQIFGDVCDRIFVDNVVPLWGEFEMDCAEFNMEGKGVHGQAIRKVEICPLPFYSLKIHPDGEVTMCCSDWKRRYVIGNLTRESFFDIWNGKKLREFWLDNARGKKEKYDICRKCLTPAFDCTDFIDDYAEVIEKNLMKSGLE